MSNKINLATVLTFAAITAASIVGAGAAQTGNASLSKSARDPLKTATHPLTPKSALPPERHSKSLVVSAATPRKSAVSAELDRVEHEKIIAPAKPPKPVAAKPIGSKPEAGAVRSSGSGINATYQKPNPKKN